MNSNGFPFLFLPPLPPLPPPVANHVRHPTSNTPVATCGVRMLNGASLNDNSVRLKQQRPSKPAGHSHMGGFKVQLQVPSAVYLFIHHTFPPPTHHP